MNSIRALGFCVALLTFALLLSGLVSQAAVAQTTVILVRHAEQMEGDQPNPSLTAVGQERARTLVHVLENVQLDAVYSTPLNRTLETAGPVADHFGLEIVTTEANASLVADMARILREDHAGQTVLVVSHSNTVPAIVNQLGGGPFEQLNHTEFDSLFIVHLRPGEPAQVMRLQYGVATK